CLDFARAIIAAWPENPYAGGFYAQDERADLLSSLARLGDVELLKSYLREVLLKDVSVDPSKSLPGVCQEYGWGTFRPELETLFKASTNETIERNGRILEQICLSKPRKKKGWSELCEALAERTLSALEAIDQEPSQRHFR